MEPIEIYIYKQEFRDKNSPETDDDYFIINMQCGRKARTVTCDPSIASLLETLNNKLLEMNIL